jgi:hypothetical protein
MCLRLRSKNDKFVAIEIFWYWKINYKLENEREDLLQKPE